MEKLAGRAVQRTNPPGDSRVNHRRNPEAVWLHFDHAGEFDQFTKSLQNRKKRLCPARTGFDTVI